MKMLKYSLLIFIFLPTLLYSFSYRPVRFEISAPASTIVNCSVLLKSDSELTENIEVELFDWEAFDGNNIRTFPFNDDWIKVSNRQIILPPGESINCNFLINVPVLKGEKKVQLGFKTKLPNSIFSISKAVPLYLSIKGTEIISMELTDISLQVNSENLVIDYAIENKGNIHLRPRVELQYLNKSNLVGSQELQDDLPIFPNTKRNFTKFIDKNEFLSGEQDLQLIMSFNNINGEQITKAYEKKFKL